MDVVRLTEISKLQFNSVIGADIKDWQLGSLTKQENQTSVSSVKLVPSLRDINTRDLSDDFKIMISCVNGMVDKLPEDKRDWDGVIRAISNTPLIKQVGHEHRKSTCYTHTDPKANSSSRSKITDEVREWYDNLIDDEVIKHAACINIKEMAGIVSSTGATLSSLDTATDQHYQHMEMLEHGALWNFDPRNRCFVLYKITLLAWSECSRRGSSEVDRNGIKGVFLKRNFEPNQDIITTISPDTRRRVIAEVERDCSGAEGQNKG